MAKYSLDSKAALNQLIKMLRDAKAKKLGVHFKRKHDVTRHKRKNEAALLPGETLTINIYMEG